MYYLKLFENFQIDHHENIIIDDIKDVEKLASIMGVTIDKQLGNGSYGMAFLTTDNRVIKLTTDEWEILSAKKIGSGNEYLVDYYQVEKVSGNLYAKNWSDYYWDEDDDKSDPEDLDLYVILMSKIEMITDPIINKICRRMSHKLKFNVKYKEYLYQDNLVSIETLKSWSMDDSNIDKLEWVVNSFKEMFKELESNGINQVDMSSGNIGMRNDHLCLFDVSGRF